MDEEMSFPNPVVRNDLPVRKARWPRVLLAVGLVLLLTVVFLPQVLNTRVGRTLLKQYLGAKFNSEVAMLDFHTSWFGGTSAVEVWMKNQDGHIIGCHEIKTDASLLKLIRGHYDLGNCTITGALVDWVVDYGDPLHSDTFNRLNGRPPTPPGGAPVAGPRVSGTVTVRGSVVNVMRGRVAPGTLQVTFQSMRFALVTGTLSAKTAADPWQWDLTAVAGDILTQPGIVSFKGTGGFGGAAAMSPANLRMTLNVEAHGIPTAACLPVYVPLFSPPDANQVLGPTIDSLKLAMQAQDGKLAFSAFDVTATRGQVHLKPVIDLQTAPMMLTTAGPATSTTGIPGGDLRRGLSVVNPFLTAAAGDGVMILRLDTLALPLDQRGWRTLSATGDMELHEVRLITPLQPEGPPTGLVSQLALLTGSTNPTPILNAGPTKFRIEGGQSTVTPGPLTVDDTLLSVTGSAAADGSMRMALSLVAAPRLTAAVPDLTSAGSAILTIPIVGTLDDPRLDVDAARGGLPAAVLPAFDAHIAAQTALYRRRQTDLAKRPQEKAVQTLIQDFASTTRPAQ